MSTPLSNLDPTNADDLFDARLRASYDAFGEESAAPPPPPQAWAGVSARLRPVAPPLTRWARLRPLLTGVMGVIIGVLLMGWWGGMQPSGRGASATSAGIKAPFESIKVPSAGIKATSAGIKAPIASAVAPNVGIKVPFESIKVPIASIKVPFESIKVPIVNALGAIAHPSGLAGSAGISADENSASGTPTVLVTLIQTEQTLAALPVADSARTERIHALHTQRLELLALVRRNDSLLAAAGETLPVVADTATLPELPKLPVKRWSVALTFAPERNFFGLGAPASDTLATLRKTHEQGRAGYNAALMAEYRLPGHDDRLSLAAGVGVSTYGAELRLTDRQTHLTTKYDTARVTETQIREVTTRAWSLGAPDIHLIPVLNVNGQVIRYDTLLIPRTDTTWTTTTNKLTDKVTTRTITPTITTREEVSTRILRPNYRFLTLPLLVRYRLGRTTDWTSSPTAPRWWADVAVGAQMQWFLGGTQLTTTDGRTYQTQRVGMNQGPFRPFTVALTGSVSMNYALTQRLSASLSPTLRWQTESVYKASTGLSQRPTATGIQLGLRYSF